MATEKEATFLGGVVKFNDILRLKIGEAPRVAFTGRSNVGKSSMLNAVTGLKVARVSSTPGKTREMNFYRWKTLILVDLPGYGFSKVAASLKEEWGREITDFLSQDQRLGLVVALVDGRHGYMPQDIEMLEFLKHEQIPFVVAFTKMDKWKSNNQRNAAERELKAVSKNAGIENYIFTSSSAKGGVKSLLEVLRRVKAE